KEIARSPPLTDNELRAIWKPTEPAPPFPALVRFLLLTAARRNEAAHMKWNEIEGADWVLPAARNKAKQELVRPLSRAALAVFASIPRIGDFAFTTNGHRPIANVSRPKTTLDKDSGVSDWPLHDLRRTARSLMSRAGVNADIAQRCLGHVIPGVRGVYDRHAYHAEMLHAFEALAAQIERVLDPQQNVVALRSKV